MRSDDEAFLELEGDAPAAPSPDPTPHLPEARDDEAFLELDEVAQSPLARAVRVVSDDDLRAVTALAEDDRPLLDALYPAQPDLAARPPSAAALAERLAFVRAALNQVTRRGAEWRARAEVAGSALARRLEALSRHGELSAAALAELMAWHERALEALITREAGDARALHPPELRRLDAEAARRGLSADLARAVAERLGVALHSDVSLAWSPCDALPGAPRTLDAAAAAITESVAHAVVALRDGALSAWLRANRGDAALVAIALESETLARGPDTDAALIGAWTLAWAMGREGVAVDGLAVTSPELLRTHLRAGRLDASRVRSQGRALGAWFRREGHGAVAAACEALARDEAHAELRLSWALGEPLRLASKPVADPTALAREVLRRPEARAEALDRWRDGTLLAWMDSLPRAKRDAAWIEDLSAPRAHDADEGAFWRGVYRRAPRASLRVFVEVGPSTRAVRFEGIGDLRSTARVAAAWGALREAHLRAELHAWLARSAPGLELDAPPIAADDGALLRLLWSLGATGLVLARGAAGAAIDTPADLVLAWRRAPLVLEAALASGLVGEWLRRFFAQDGVSGLSLGDAMTRWGVGFGAGVAPSGVAALRCALLCGLTAIPSDPTASGGPDGRALVGFVGVDPSSRDDAVWSELLDAPGDPLGQGTALLWAARHAPALGVLAAAGDGAAREAVRDALLAAGRPVPSAPLAETLADQAAQAERRARQRALLEESERIAAQREAARSQLEREAARVAAEREAARRDAARDALRREVDREVARIESEREAARRTHERALAALQAERALAEAEHARAMTELSLARSHASGDAAEVVDAAALEARWREAARRAAEEEVLRAVARSEDELREAALRAAEQAAAEEVRLAAESLGVERARRARAEAALSSTLGELLAREGALRAEAERAAEEATKMALSLAEGETHRVEAEQRAEEATRRAESAKAERVAAEWAAQQARAEEEIEALAKAERERRAEATRLALEEMGSRPAVAEEPAVDEGFTEDPTAEAADDVGEELHSSDRHEVAYDRLAVAYEGVDDAALAGLRDAVDAWSRGRPRHPLAALGSAMVVDSVTMIPAFEAHVATRLESRAIERRVLSGDDDEEAVEVGAEASAGGDDALDAWLLDLRPVDTWDRLTVDAPLALRPRREPCPRCAVDAPEGIPTGRLRCEVCDALGTVVCARCGGFGRSRCGRCGGNGQVLVPGGGTRRCPACDGRGDVACGCALGRVACGACEGVGHGPCPICGAVGVVETRPWVSQSALGVRARAVVAVGLPPGLAAEVGVPGSEADAVVHLEADAIDPAALARELPHDHLGAALADLLSAESARASEGQRVTRQQVVVWRYPAWRVQVHVNGAAFTLWVHGARRRVWAERSPLDAATESAVASVRALITSDSLDAAIDRLVALAGEDPGHAGARDAATALGDAVLAMAERGELYEAQRLAGRGAAVRWPDAVSRLVQAERVAGRRLHKRSSWALLEDARSALQRGLDARALDLLGELHAAAPGDAEAEALAGELGRRLDAQAEALVSRGALDDATALLSRVRSSGAPAVLAAMASSAASLQRARRRAAQRTAAVVAAALALVALAVLALLR